MNGCGGLWLSLIHFSWPPTLANKMSNKTKLEKIGFRVRIVRGTEVQEPFKSVINGFVKWETIAETTKENDDKFLGRVLSEIKQRELK